MSLGFLRFFLSGSALRPVCLVNLPLARKPATLGPACHCHVVSPWPCVSFSTDTESGDSDIQRESQKKSKKLYPKAKVAIGSVGRKISHRHIQLLGEDGEELGVKHRADVIRLLDQTDLKLVAINDKCDPPIYKLMTGKEIHEEQLKLREIQKAKKGPVQSKELSFFSDISPHDLNVKMRQIVTWLEKNHHVRLTVKGGTDKDTPVDKILTQMLEKISVPTAFISNPTLVRGGRGAMCILRLASDKEQQKKNSRKNEKSDLIEEVKRDAVVSEEPKDLNQQ